MKKVCGFHAGVLFSLVVCLLTVACSGSILPLRCVSDKSGGIISGVTRRNGKWQLGCTKRHDHKRPGLLSNFPSRRPGRDISTWTFTKGGTASPQLVREQCCAGCGVHETVMSPSKLGAVTKSFKSRLAGEAQPPNTHGRHRGPNVLTPRSP